MNSGKNIYLTHDVGFNITRLKTVNQIIILLLPMKPSCYITITITFHSL